MAETISETLRSPRRGVLKPTFANVLTPEEVAAEELADREDYERTMSPTEISRADALALGYDPNQPRVPRDSPEGGQFAPSEGAPSGGGKSKRKGVPVDLSSPEKTAAHLHSQLRAMFPDHYVKVVGQRGVGIEVARLDDEAYAKQQITEGYSNTPPNLMVKIVMGLEQGFGPSQEWTGPNLKVIPAAKNPELDEAKIKPIKRAFNVTPEKAVAAILNWFNANQAVLKGQ